MSTLLKSLLTLPIVAALSACGGGGGGSSSTLSGFTKASDVDLTNGGTITYTEGVSNEVDYTADTTTFKVTSLTNLQENLANPVSEWSLSSSGNYFEGYYTTAGGKTFRANSLTGSIFSFDSKTLIVDGSLENYMLGFNVLDLGWDYQSASTFTTGAGTGSGSAGSISIGQMTYASGIPSSGSATYDGYSTGRVTSSNGEAYFTFSDISASVDFANKSATITSTNSQYTEDLVTRYADSSLNFTGQMSYSPGTNNLSGTITTSTSSAVNGKVYGRFYGPNAEEIGGVFNTDINGVSIYSGAYGAKQ
jgi:hypothetical protein